MGDTATPETLIGRGPRSAAKGRMVSEALIAGLPGALSAGLAKRAEYQSVLVFEVAGARIVCVFNDQPPLAVDAAYDAFPLWSRQRSDRSLG